MSMLSLNRYFCIVPVLAVISWTTTVLGLLLLWIIDDSHKRYKPSQASIVLISNVGAEHKIFFVTGTALTFTFYTISLILERYLRDSQKLPGVVRLKEFYVDNIAIVFGILSGINLLLLSCFDIVYFKQKHWIFTKLFVVLVILSGIFQTWRIILEEHNQVKRKQKRVVIKTILVLVSIVIAIIFVALKGSCGVTDSSISLSLHCDNVVSVAAVFEWLLAIVFNFYLASLILDFVWAASSDNEEEKERDVEKEASETVTNKL